ncbi:MAG: flagellar basal-body MS-ring/collar protein FliF [Solirubrobacteraceae bacterium]
MPAFGELAKRMSPKGWAMIGGSVLVGIVFLVLVMQMASAPSYTTLMAGIDPSQTGKITSTLSAQGIAYQLQNNGTAIGVQPSQTAQARVALATAGLLTTQQPGFSLLNSSSLGQSNFQQQVTYERALEGQLASTIDTISGVSSAVVNLVLPNTQTQLFSNNPQPATASVLLGSTSVGPAQVRGIAQLVASSVPGLSLDKVTITGSDGTLLWPSSSAADSTGGLLAQESAAQRYDATMSGEVNAMLAQTLGTGKAQVVVNATVNANQTTQDTLTYAKKGVPLTQTISQESLKGAGAATGGAAGTAGNIGGVAGTPTGGANSSYNNTTTNTTYGVNKTITHTVVAPGAVTQQSISVLVDKSVPAASIPAIKSAVENAVGFTAKRGDTISIGQLAFKGQPVTAASPAATSSTSSMMNYAKYGLAGLGSMIFLAFMARAVRKRERESIAGQPTWLRELEAPRTLASLERRQQPLGVAPPEETQVQALRPAVNVARRQVEDLVQRDPERVAQQVRAWMAED